jgi:3-phenylpropionate/cinnamic acid dioxygenase small subunit
MSNVSVVTSPEEQRELERFYFHEARLLDNRQYQQWLALITEDMKYIMPARVNVQVNNRERGSEEMISVERELEGPEGMGNPIRDENYIHLMLRVERAYKINSWSENPPARTRRIVGNVELMGREGEELDVVNNFHMHYARPGSANFMYVGQRRDKLVRADEGFKIKHREVILDYADIDKPTLGLIF